MLFRCRRLEDAVSADEIVKHLETTFGGIVATMLSTCMGMTALARVRSVMAWKGSPSHRELRGPNYS